MRGLKAVFVHTPHLLGVILYGSGLLTQGVPGVPQDPLAPRRGPLGSSADRDRAIETGRGGRDQDDQDVSLKQFSAVENGLERLANGLNFSKMPSGCEFRAVQGQFRTV